MARNRRPECPLYERLPEADRPNFKDISRSFWTKSFLKAAARLEITDEIKLTIAAQACVLAASP